MIHYHFFKNAGTSVDRTLRENFGITWTTYEADNALPLASSNVSQYLVRNPWIVALSSHTAQLPLPKVRGCAIIPVIFLRHPISRALAVYEFERRQDSNTPGAKVAKETDFVGYVKWRLDGEYDPAICNFHSQRLAMGSTRGTYRQRAFDTLAQLPFVGIVEEFDRSIERLEEYLRVSFPNIRLSAYHENRLGPEGDLEQGLRAVRAQLGPDLFRKLEEANVEDLELWASARERYT